MKYILPEEMLKKAFIASNGELAWKREDLLEVIDAYNNLGYPVEGLDVWIVDNQGNWNGIIPQKDGSIPGVYAWSANPKEKSENLQSYQVRIKKELLEILQKFNVENEVEEKYLPMIRYNLFVEAEYEYKAV